MFYKKFQARDGKWYPRSVTNGKTITTDQIADKLDEISTVSRGDCYAVLKDLAKVMRTYMAMGRTVKLDGVGTFYYTATSNGNGAETADGVSAAQINDVRVRFIPEYDRKADGSVDTRSMVASVDWELYPETATGAQATTPAADTPQTGGSDDQQQDPMG